QAQPPALRSARQPMNVSRGKNRLLPGLPNVSSRLIPMPGCRPSGPKSIRSWLPLMSAAWKGGGVEALSSCRPGRLARDRRKITCSGPAKLLVRINCCSRLPRWDLLLWICCGGRKKKDGCSGAAGRAAGGGGGATGGAAGLAVTWTPPGSAEVPAGPVDVAVMNILADPEGHRKAQMLRRVPDDFDELPEDEQQEILDQLAEVVASVDPAPLPPP